MTVLISNLYNSLYAIIILLFFSVLTRIALTLIKQTWSNTFSHTVTILSLPISTYVITSVISDNIALSLGLVGALSIVRFRHPVRSPLELSIYFYLIAMGISSSVSLKWTILLGSVTFLLLLVTYFVNTILNKFNKNLFIPSFTEGNILSTLEINSLLPLSELEQFEDLISISNSDNIFYYKFASNNYKNLLKIYSKYKDYKKI